MLIPILASVPLTVIVASCDENNIAADFNNLDLGNAVVPIMMPVPAPLVSHHHKIHVTPYSDHLHLKECNGAIDNAIGIM